MIRILLCILMVFVLVGCEEVVEEDGVQWVIPPPKTEKPEAKSDPEPVVRRESTVISFPRREREAEKTEKTQPKVLDRLKEFGEISSIFIISKLRKNWQCKFYVEKEGSSHMSFSVNAKSFEEVVKRALDKAKSL